VVFSRTPQTIPATRQLAVADDRTIVENCEEDAGWDAFLQADTWLAQIAQPFAVGFCGKASGFPLL
jgi:hypothetical protein